MEPDYRWRRGEWLAATLPTEEIVGLGFLTDENTLRSDDAEDRPIGSVIEYVQLTNIAHASVRDRTFEIDGTEVKAVCTRMGKTPVALWHSHTQSVEPSVEDVEFFPAWLVEIGAIFHAPSGQTTLYTGDGVCFPVMQTTTPLATTDNTPQEN
jgi:proteasome lid subunit RPN8/RPN11